MNIALVGVDKRITEILNLTKLISLPIEIRAPIISPLMICPKPLEPQPEVATG